MSFEYDVANALSQAAKKSKEVMAQAATAVMEAVKSSLDSIKNRIDGFKADRANRKAEELARVVARFEERVRLYSCVVSQGKENLSETKAQKIRNRLNLIELNRFVKVQRNILYEEPYTSEVTSSLITQSDELIERLAKTGVPDKALQDDIADFIKTCKSREGAGLVAVMAEMEDSTLTDKERIKRAKAKVNSKDAEKCIATAYNALISDIKLVNDLLECDHADTGVETISTFSTFGMCDGEEDDYQADSTMRIKSKNREEAE